MDEQQELTEFTEQIKTVKDRVKELLKDHPEARSYDKWLILRYLEKYHPNLGVSAEKINIKELDDVPPFESITRVRRKIQNEEGLYLPKKKVEEQRRLRQEEFRKNINKV